MKTTVYLQIVPRWTRWTNRDGDHQLESLHVERVSAKQPKKSISGAIVTKLTLDIADAAFLPIRPEAIVVIPADHTQAIEIETNPVEIPA